MIPPMNIGDLAVGRIHKQNFYGKITAVGIDSATIEGGFLTEQQRVGLSWRDCCVTPERTKVKEISFWKKYVALAEEFDAHEIDRFVTNNDDEDDGS